jgi:hypothetical protein
VIVHIGIDSCGARISEYIGCAVMLPCQTVAWSDADARSGYLRRFGSLGVHADLPVLVPGDLSLDPREITCLGCLAVLDQRLALRRGRLGWRDY